MSERSVWQTNPDDFSGKLLFIVALLMFCAGALLPTLSVAAETAADRVTGAAAGINLAGPADWNTELPLVDVFRLSREWISQRRGAGWGQGPKLEVDQHGWIRRLEPGCFAETPMCTIDGGHYPSGVFTVLWDGAGRIELSKGDVRKSADGMMQVQIDSSGGGFFLRVLETNPQNPIRNIRVLMPGFTDEQVRRNPWHPAFLKRWQGMACLRFMDLQATNNSEQQQWSDRPRMDDSTWTRHGLPVEMLCDLANRLESDAWFCLPHRADDDYVRQFAQLVKQRLHPDRRVWVEYSNEVWNGQFAQHQYAAKQGQALGLAEKPWEAAWYYTAQRSTEIFAIFESVFGGRERLIRVLPSQAANAYVATQIVGWKDTAAHADVLAIAPYISMNIPAQGEKLNADKVLKWSAEEFLDDVEANALPQSIRWIQDNRKVAEAHGLQLACYEAGQHFVGIQGAENNEQLTALLKSVNAHPRMRDIYAAYFDAWEKHGGGLLCHFSSVGGWSKWGSWGLLQFADDDPSVSPKFTATMQWAQKLGQRVNIPE
ncbi:MAG: hypothetical protein KDA89_00780 [Planctomycetaceae bacterium]|nr:hypothetical protein [Planctomycetaceae bacterium]